MQNSGIKFDDYRKGGYEPIAEVLFHELNVDAYFPEYDDERSGDFAPLRW